jgi:hypothetical protein
MSLIFSSVISNVYLRGVLSCSVCVHNLRLSNTFMSLCHLGLVISIHKRKALDEFLYTKQLYDCLLF